MMFEEQMDTAVSIGRFSAAQGVAKLDSMIKDLMQNQDQSKFECSGSTSMECSSLSISAC